MRFDKIASALPELTLQAPELAEALLEQIEQALLDDRQLRCSYFAAHSNKLREAVLTPLALIQRGNITSLAAVTEPYEDVRLYVAHRFQQVEILETSSSRPDNFNLDNYIAIAGGALQLTSPDAAPIALQAWINEDLARQLRETLLSSDMQLESEEDGHRLIATVQYSWQLRWWILSQAAPSLCGSWQTYGMSLSVDWRLRECLTPAVLQPSRVHAERSERFRTGQHQSHLSRR